MIKELFGSKEILKYDMGYCKLYDTKYNGMKCTKMYFTIDSPSKYEILKNVNNHNIIPVYKITQHSVFTKRIVPFKTIFDRTKIKYNEYVLKKIKDTLNYIHNDLKLEVCSLDINSLFADEFGNVLLGNFSKAIPFVSTYKDDFLLNALCNIMLERDINEIDEESLFTELENKDLFDNLSVEQKKEFLNKTYRNKNELIEPIKQNIFRRALKDLNNPLESEYKIFVLNILMKIDDSMLKEFSKMMFSILDSSVRMHLLKNLDSVQDLNDCVNEIALGIKVKDKPLKQETIHFIFKNETSFNTKSMHSIIETIGLNVNDTESIGLVCSKLIECNRNDYYKPVYKLMMQFLTIDKNKALIYRTLEKYYPNFDKYKLSTEMLPLLCSKLTDKEDQDACFLIVEKILNFLKKHKNELPGNDWSFKGIKGIFQSKKPNETETAEARIMKLARDENADEWAEQDL